MRMRLLIALLILVLVLVAAAMAAWFLSAPRTINSETAAAVSAPGDAAAGRIVFYAGGCGSAMQVLADPIRRGSEGDWS